MSTSRSERLPWEYAGGPNVGDEVPITGEPREEVAPGVPAESEESGRQPSEPERNGDETEMREVRAADPDLSEETNARLTDELRDVVGEQQVRVPVDRPRASRGEHPHQQGLGAYLSMNRFQLVRLTAVVLTFGGILALITGEWWVLPLAAGLHALGTMTVALTAIRMTTTSEHPSPDIAAAMAEEGVRNPDEHFSRMVEEFREEPERGTTEVLSPGFNERTADVLDDPADAAAQQSSAMTPTGQPTEASGQGGAPDVLIWTMIIGLFALSVALPAAMGGGWLWLLTAVMVPLLVAWVLVQVAIRRGGELHIRGRGSLVAIVACTAVAVAGFCAVVAFAFQH
jgi:hypothetical protein